MTHTVLITFDNEHHHTNTVTSHSSRPKTTPNNAYHVHLTRSGHTTTLAKHEEYSLQDDRRLHNYKSVVVVVVHCSNSNTLHAVLAKRVERWLEGTAVPGFAWGGRTFQLRRGCPLSYSHLFVQ